MSKTKKQTQKRNHKKTNRRRKVHGGDNRGENSEEQYTIKVPNDYSNSYKEKNDEKITRKTTIENRIKDLEEELNHLPKNMEGLTKNMITRQEIKQLYEELEELQKDDFHIFLMEGLGCKKPTEDDIQGYVDYLNIPKENLTILCKVETQKITKTVGHLKNIVKTSCGLKPLTNTSYLYTIANSILQQAYNNNAVYVYGFSFGGMIVNRILDILIKKMNSDAESEKQQLQNLLKKIHFATFGSIYITPKPTTDIDITHYIAVGDVANTCTRSIKHKQQISENELNDYIKLQDFGISYKIRENDPKKIYDLCFLNKADKHSCRKIISNIPFARTITEWNIHNSYFPLIHGLMSNKTTKIEDLL